MHHRLTERIPDHLVCHWRSVSVFWGRLAIGGVVGFFVPIGVALAWLPFHRSSASFQLAVVCLASIVLFCGWLGIVYSIGRFIANEWSQSKLPVVELTGDRLIVHWNGETIESSVADCNLRIGRAWQMKYAARKARGIPIGDRDLILIDLPPIYRDMLGQERANTTVAVGYTDDSMKAWSLALGMGGEV